MALDRLGSKWNYDTACPGRAGVTWHGSGRRVGASTQTFTQHLLLSNLRKTQQRPRLNISMCRYELLNTLIVFFQSRFARKPIPYDF